jgi:hypothetical protein
MTAVEWLKEQMKDDRFLAAFEDEFKQAKEIEKQQLEKAFVDGAFLFRGDDKDNRFNEWFEKFKNE